LWREILKLDLRQGIISGLEVLLDHQAIKGGNIET